MCRIARFVPLLALVLALPSFASARPVLSPGELSVGAEFHSFNSPSIGRTGLEASATPNVSPGLGFTGRYALSNEFAILGEAAFFHRFRKGGDPATLWAVGAGMQYNLIPSRLAAILLRAGVQFLPRPDVDGQEFGVRFYAGPGFEARVAEALSLQIYSPLLDLQVGGDSTDFDLNLLPNLGIFLYF